MRTSISNFRSHLKEHMIPDVPLWWLGAIVVGHDVIGISAFPILADNAIDGVQSERRTEIAQNRIDQLAAHTPGKEFQDGQDVDAEFFSNDRFGGW